MSTTRRSLPRLLFLALLICATWLIAGLFFVTQHNLIAAARREPDVESERFIIMLGSTLAWSLVTPFVFFAAERFPLRRPNLARNTLVMLGVAIAVTAVRAPTDAMLPHLLEGYGVKENFRQAMAALAHTHFLFALVIIGIANFIRLQHEASERRRAAARSRAALAQAKLRRLRADLNPHFLFNALNAVVALMHANPTAAERTLDTLGDLLRRSIELEDVAEVPLVDEIEFVERYLDVQKTRFGERLRTRVAVESLDLLLSAVPPLLIQPLVENAIVHSIATRRDGGTVEVRVARDGAWLDLEVRDDGPGCDPRRLFAGGGLGVPNAKTRLEHLYGGEQSLNFRREDGTFAAVVRIPLRYIERRLAS